MQLYLEDLEFAPDQIKRGFSTGGALFVSIGNTYFPQENWYDMAWLDLKYWIPRLVSFCSNHTDSCQMPFMDGPYTIKLTRTKNNIIQAACLYYDTTMIPHTEIVLSKFIVSVIRCCRKYDRFLYENGKPAQFAEEIKQLKSTLYT